MRECEGWAGELEGLSIAKAVAPRLSKASDKLNNTLLKSLHSVCASFDGDAYDNALTTAIRLGQIADVVGGVNVCFAEGIKQCTKRVLNAHVLHAESVKGAKAAYRSQREQEVRVLAPSHPAPPSLISSPC